MQLFTAKKVCFILTVKLQSFALESMDALRTGSILVTEGELCLKEVCPQFLGEKEAC